MERNKKIPIVMVYNNKRKELVEQTIRTLTDNTKHPYSFYFAEDKIGDDSNYIKLRNELIKSIGIEWDYLLYCDDDLFFTNHWLCKMKAVLKKNKDVGILSAVSWHTQKRVEERSDMFITDKVVSGGCLLFSKESWKDCGLFTEGVTKTYDICKKATISGWKIGFLKDELTVIHCGLNSILNNKGRAKTTFDRMQLLCDSVGATTNYENSNIK